MRCEPPDKRFYTELQDLNAGFLALITDRALAWQGPLLGLDAGLVSAIRSLSEAELEFVAATPGPLAEFRTLRPANIVADAQPDMGPDDTRWLDSARLYSTQLITYIWQRVSQGGLIASLCVGPATDRVGHLVDMSFRDIQACTGGPSYQLQARFAHHPQFWPDLIRAARGGNQNLRYLSRLAILPLALAESR